MENIILQPNISTGFDLFNGVGDFLFLDEMVSQVDGFQVPDLMDFETSVSPYDFPSRMLLGNEDRSSSLVLDHHQTWYKNQVKFSEKNGTTVPKNTSSQLILPHWTSSWVQQRHPVSSITDRFLYAVRYITECQREGDVLVQVWLPTRRGDRKVLTTSGQPFDLSSSNVSLANYRMISMNYNFSAEQNSGETVGLPGRVFLGKLPEWTPDVRYFSRYEYPRVDYAQQLGVRGTLAVPVFERGNRSCLGVLEIVMTKDKMHYANDLERICIALQAVDLTTSEVSTVPRTLVSNSSYKTALPEIQGVLRTICKTHNLPLAQTWFSCIQQGKGGCRHSSENYKDCVSTVDEACYVNYFRMRGFQEACSEHHLLKGQGLVGKAFATNEPCFSPDITSLHKTDYPLAHHARKFHLRAAVAIRMRSTEVKHNDYVLEFFLPIDCVESEGQKAMLNSLSRTLRKVCKSLWIISEGEIKNEAKLQAEEANPVGISYEDGSKRSPNAPGSTGIVHPEVVCSSREINIHSHIRQQHPQGSVHDNLDFSESSHRQTESSGCERDKHFQKTECPLSLEILQQHFSSSLKDAAKNLGVSPTTLKRICGHHGIGPWPSKKPRNVDQSLRKLQEKINSAGRANGVIQDTPLPPNSTNSSSLQEKPSESNASLPLKRSSHSDYSNFHQQVGVCGFRGNANARYSPSSSSSCHRSYSNIIPGPSGVQQLTQVSCFTRQGESEEDNHSDLHKRVNSKLELCVSADEQSRCQGKLEYLNSGYEQVCRGYIFPVDNEHDGLLRIKAVYGEKRVRLKLQPNWSFQDLKQEILKRFNIREFSSVQVKYLDDDSEWVLLTCDADLQECAEVCRSSRANTIRISVHCQQAEC